MDPLRAERIYDRQADLLARLLEDIWAVVGTGQPLDAHLSRFYHGHPEFGSRDRRLFSGTLFSYFRWKGWMDLITKRPDAACVFSHLLEATEINPAIVRLATRAGRPETILIPLGTLSVPEKAIQLGTITGKELNLEQLVPSWILSLLPETNRNRLIEAFQNPPPTWLRSRSGERDALLAAIRNQGVEPISHPMLPSAASVPRGINLRSLPRPLRDRVDVQDLASQITGLICAPQPGQRWWDACCGSGGKTLYLAEIGGETVSLLATDIRPTILGELERRMRETGFRNIKTAVWDGVGESPPEGEFDGILLDAPCSGTGTWHRNPDARWRICSERVAQLAELQARLLDACSARLAPGGTLIYATCSILPIENEQVVANFLAASPEFAPVPFTNPLDHTPCPGQLRIQPWEGPCNGMFIAKLARRSGQTDN